MATSNAIVTKVTEPALTLIYFWFKIGNMKKNMGNTDRVVRIVLAAIIAVLYFTHFITGTLGIVLLVVAGVFVLTSLVSFCPLYTLIGVKTCSARK